VFGEKVRGLRGLRLTRRQQVFILCLIPVAFGFSVWGLQGPTAAAEDPTSAQAERGDLVKTVGAVGRIVQAKGPGAIARPSGGGGGSTGGSPAVADTPADAVFPGTTGQIKRYLVKRGQRVVAGQPLAVLTDGGVAASSVRQARNDLATARLELRRIRTSDPVKGLPATSAERAFGRAAVIAAQEKLNQVIRGAHSADVDLAWQELRKAEADLETLKGGAPQARANEIAVARRTLEQAQDRLERALTPDAADVAAATAELRKAEADLAVLVRAPDGPTPEELQAARQAVATAEAYLAQVKAADPPDQATIRQAQLEVERAKRDLIVLQKAPRGPTAEEVASARQAVEAARAKLNKLLRPGGNSAEVRAARVDIERAKADLQRLEDGPSKAQIASAEATVKAAVSKLNRLLDPPLRADLALARSELARAKADRSVLKTRGAPGSATDIGLARLRVERAQIMLASAVQARRALTVRAPAAGTVTSLTSAPGAPVDTTVPIATVSDLDDLAVVVNLSEFDVAQVRPGQLAELSIDALGGEAFPGTVRFASATGVEANGLVTYPVQLRLPEVEAVKPGMNVSVTIVVARKRDAIQVPLEAVNQDGDEPIVTVVDSAGEPVEERVVELGLDDGKNIEIRKGLREGERVELMLPPPEE
jgi:HlyD family secretion protein